MKLDSSVKISAGLVVLALVPSLVGAQQPSEQDRRFSDLAGSDRVLSYVVNLDLDPAFYQVAIGVRDETAKTASYLRRDVVVATP